MKGFIRIALCAATASLAAPASLAFAQATSNVATSTTPAERQSDSRAQLEAQARAAEGAGRTQEAWILRTRLQRGDFQEGDRILITFLGISSARDTFVVRAGKVLQFPGMDDLSLETVLRSELTARLSTHLAKYLRDPSVRATPLVRIGVLGRVARPNYYYTAADIVLPDIFTLAGGLAPDADLNRTVIRRGTQVIWAEADTRRALSDGLSLDRLSLRANDEIEVLEKKKGVSWQTVVTAASGALAVILSVVTLTRPR